MSSTTSEQRRPTMGGRPIWGRRAAAAVTIAASMLIQACTGGGAATATPQAPASPAASPTAAAATPAPATATPAATPAPATATPAATTSPTPTPPAVVAPTGEIRAITVDEYNTTDPQNHRQVANLTVNQMVYDQLVTFDNNLQIQPRLAESWTNPSDTVWEFKLREGVSFHSGETFDANSVKATFDRMLAHKDFLQFGFWALLERVEVVDPTTVRFHTKGPWGGILGFLAQADMLPPSTDPGIELIQTPIGTGPYKFVRWDQGADVVLEANTDYWGGSPSVKTIKIRGIQDLPARAAAAASSAADIVPNLPVEQIESVRANPDMDVLQNPGLRYAFYALNFKQGPFQDPRVREAAVRAIDGDAILGSILAGSGLKLLGVLSPLSQGARSPLDESVVSYDPEKSRALLKEAGLTTPVPLRFVYGVFTNPDVAQALVEYLKAVGFDPQVQTVDVAEFLEIRAAGNFDILTGQITSATAELVLGLYYSATSTIGFLNEATSTRLAEARATVDQPKRLELLGDVQELVWADHALLWQYQLADTTAVSKKIGNFTWRPDYYWQFHKFTLSP